MTENLFSSTFRLFPRSSFLEGMGRVLDMGQGLSQYNASSSSTRADSLAIASDWNMVGMDLYGAMGEYEREERAKTRPTGAS